MTDHRQELSQRLALARSAKRRGKSFLRLWHVENALYIRRQIRTEKS